ncbi:GDSL-type esterase/lipase family protein [Xanthobacter autotrophicus]|uniref:SGNH/GDSL hydrolase family protein n=1 Tax=Xanthobacter TaxID=279 RepID=UPI0024AA36B8|nr:GDSL-type esterase/lipase family protein [Xanthobacter autotrophicus]MDI4662834.1 GDSL-type esterase/lipase family protein [Xanthobacter autotrophicus]
MSIDGIARGLAAAPWTRLRSPNLVATLGDSLAASLHLDSNRRNLCTRSQLAWASVLSGSRLRFVTSSGGNFGWSGERTDQIMARLQATINSGAGTVILIAGTNDVGQLYPTSGTCAATAAANIAIMARAIVNAGAQVVIELPPGSANYTVTQIGILNELNQRLTEFALTMPRVYLHDASKMILNPTNSTSALAPKPNYFYDLTHPQGLGAYYWGKSLANLLSQIIPPYPRFGHLDLTDVQPTAFLSNALFVTQSGGTNSIGAALTSGAVPASWELNRSGSPTVAITYGTDDGAPLDPSIGSKAILTITFTAAGERLYLRQSVSTGLWNPGDVFDFGCRMRLVSGMSAVAATRMFVPVALDGVELANYSMIEAAPSEYGPDESYTLDHVIGPVTVQAGTAKNWLVPRAEIVARTAGTAVVEVSRFAMRRRISA